jgi:hypothetical protein
MRRLGLVPLVAGIALIATFCVVIPPVVAGSDYAAVNGIGFIAGPIGAVLVLAGAVMLLSRGGPPFE